MADEKLNFKLDTNIKDAAKDTQDLKQNLEGAVETTEKLDKATEKGKKGFKGIGTAVKGVGTALKAAGIGLIVALLAKLMDVFRSNQKVLDFFNTSMEVLSIAFNDLFGFLDKNVGKVVGYFKSIFKDPKQSLIDFGNAIKANLIERFNSFLDTLGFIASAVKKVFARDFAGALADIKSAGKESIDMLTGVNNSVDKIGEAVTTAAGAIGDYATKTLEAASATIELRNAAEVAAVVQQGLIEKYDRQAELQRQIRDDATLDMETRIAANEKLGQILDDQEKAMLKQADLQVGAAAREYEKNANQENYIALLTAQNEREGVLAQVTGLRSEQLSNVNALLLEQKAIEEEDRTKRLEEETMLQELMDENLIASIENLEEKALKELEIQYNKDIAEIEQYENKAALKEQIDLKYNTKREAIEKTVAANQKKFDKLNADAKVDIAKQTLGNIATIMGKESKAAKIAAASIATIDALKGAVSAFSSLAPIPFVGPVLGGIAAAAALVAGYKNVKEIMATKTPGGGGGGGAPSPPSGATPSVPAEGGMPAPEMVGGAFELGGGTEPEPAKAYVVADEMTDKQDQLAGIRRRASV